MKANRVRDSFWLCGGPCRGYAREWILRALGRHSSLGNFSRMPQENEPATKPTPTFRQTLIRVMAAQVLWIVLLLLLQMHYSG